MSEHTAKPAEGSVGKTREQRMHDIVYSCDHRPELAERIVNLEDENAKLRELCSEMFSFEDSTPCKTKDTVWMLEGWSQRMSELGIEVDA